MKISKSKFLKMKSKFFNLKHLSSKFENFEIHFKTSNIFIKISLKSLFHPGKFRPNPPKSSQNHVFSIHQNFQSYSKHLKSFSIIFKKFFHSRSKTTNSPQSKQKRKVESQPSSKTSIPNPLIRHPFHQTHEHNLQSFQSSSHTS